MDSDGSGDLSLEELIAGASILNLTSEEATHLFNELDYDGSGSSIVLFLCT